MNKVIDLEYLRGLAAGSAGFTRFPRPSAGWLKTVRDALGMTLSELAQRLKVTAPAVHSFERAETEDRITLGTLRRSAEAMDCDLVYILVPRIPALEAASTSYERPPVASVDSTSKVTDKTWHALQDGSG